MTKPMKHAEVIRAAADGKEIEYRYATKTWVKWDASYSTLSPFFENKVEWRIKPEPKPDVVEYWYAWIDDMEFVSTRERANLIITFDGETGELKEAKVIGKD